MGVLNGKTAVVTGSSRGLGLAIAQAMAAEGANVVLAARTKETLDQAVNRLQNQGYQAVGFVCDTSNQAEVEALAEKAIQTFGNLDIWVNNAGVSSPYGPTMSVSVDRFEKVVNTNIFGVYYGTHAAMKHFLQQGSGKLVNVVGRGADEPVPYQNAYASSKTWVKSFTIALAKEYHHTGVSIIAFNPGLVLTDMLTQIDVVGGFKDKVSPLNTVIRLWANPPEVPAKKVVRLVSSATDGKTGLYVKTLTLRLIIRGVVREIWRKITKQPSRTPTIEVWEVD